MERKPYIIERFLYGHHTFSRNCQIIFISIIELTPSAIHLFLNLELRILVLLLSNLKFDNNLIHSLNLCQQSYQLTSPKFNLSTQPYILPLLDKFPQNKKPWLSFRLKARSQITESAYLLMFLHSCFSTLDINTTVSTWLSWVNISTLQLKPNTFSTLHIITHYFCYKVQLLIKTLTPINQLFYFLIHL